MSLDNLGIVESTSIDLYCEKGTRVLAVEDGEVISIEDFTGPKAGYPWWNDTQAVLVLGKSGIVVYGEVSPKVKVGDKVLKGQQVAVVEIPVLKKFKRQQDLI